MSLISANSVTPRDRASGLHTRAFWRIVPLLMVCYTVSYLNRINIGFAKLQMSVTLGFSDAVFGLGAGIFFIGYFIFGVPSNLLMERFGPRRWIGSLMILWGVTSSAFVLVRTPREFGLVGFLLGSVEAGFYPGVIVYLARWFPSRQRARIMALFMSAIPLAGIFGNPLSGWIMAKFNSSAHLLGWQWLFLIEALPAILLGILILFLLEDSISAARWLTEPDKKYLAGEIAADETGTEGQASGIVASIRDRRVWLMCFIYFAFIVGQYGLTFWMPTLIYGMGVHGTARIGILSAVPFLCAVVAMNLCGRSADLHRERRWHLIVPALMGAAGFCVAAEFAGNTAVSLAALSLATAGVITCAPLFWSLPTSFLRGTAAAAGLAIINSIGNLAGFASPSMIGYLRSLTHSSQSGMYLLAAIMVAGAAAVWMVPARLVNH